jgi:hypothetical protein
MSLSNLLKIKQFRESNDATMRSHIQSQISMIMTNLIDVEISNTSIENFTFLCENFIVESDYLFLYSILTKKIVFFNILLEKFKDKINLVRLATQILKFGFVKILDTVYPLLTRYQVLCALENYFGTDNVKIMAHYLYYRFHASPFYPEMERLLIAMEPLGKDQTAVLNEFKTEVMFIQHLTEMFGRGIQPHSRIHYYCAFGKENRLVKELSHLFTTEIKQVLDQYFANLYQFGVELCEQLKDPEIPKITIPGNYNFFIDFIDFASENNIPISDFCNIILPISADHAEKSLAIFELLLICEGKTLLECLLE